MYADPDVLSPVQQIVLNLMTAGSNVTAAAEAAGVHRNTIYNWRRACPAFRTAWFEILEEQALFWRDEFSALAQLAVETVRSIMANASHNPAPRLRAALAVLKNVLSVPPAAKVHNSAQASTAEPAANPAVSPSNRTRSPLTPPARRRAASSNQLPDSNSPRVPHNAASGHPEAD